MLDEGVQLSPGRRFRSDFYRSRQRRPPARMTAPSRTVNSAELAQRVAHLCLEYKAEDVIILDLTGVTDMADFFVIASGTSDTHVRSTAQRVMETMKGAGQPVHHEEGVPQGRWVLLDFVD